MIDINADLGEGFGPWRLGDDIALLSIVTSANVACGFHAGDPLIMRRTCAAAIERGVVIGAQVSYRDLPGFGRREMDLDPDELTAELLYQIAALDGIARAEGGHVGYVKPHGALYNRLVRDPVQAGALAAAVAAHDPSLPVLSLPHSVLHDLGSVTVVNECFADRAYTPDGMLVARREPGAVIHDVDQVAERTLRMAVERTVEAVDGSAVPIEARSICVHGDTPGAVELARTVRISLEEAGVPLGPFA